MNDMTSIPISQRQFLPEEPSAPGEQVTPRWRRRPMLFGAVAAAALALGWITLAPHDQAAVAAPTPLVTVATPLERTITGWDELIGRFEASNAVELRPRVSGQVTQVLFRDGQFVSRGQPLFVIDPRPYRAALAEAQAGVATARSDLLLAQANLSRALTLVAADAVAKSEVDALRAKVRASQAALAAAQARVASRALDVSFTTVRAPISGRTSDRRVDPGNLVAAGDGPGATLLTTIAATTPMHFTFEGSESLFLKARRQGAGDGTPVEIRLADETDYRWHGRLDFTDNGLDTHSGTIRARAVVDNPGNFLAPGMFGNMRLAVGGKTKALLVPETAIQTDQARKALLVVTKDGTVTAKPVVLGPTVGNLRAIRSGLAPSDQVIIAGTQMAMPGSKVNVRRERISPPPSVPAADVAPLDAPPGKATITG